MNAAPTIEYTQQQLEELQEFFVAHHADCFWSWNTKTQVTRENAGRILRLARTHGFQAGQALAIRMQNGALESHEPCR